MARNSTYNILMYSHDTYGLGHIRRTMAIAAHLKAPEVNVLILTGSPIAGRFSFPEQIDFVRIPGMIKKTNEEYRPLSIKINPKHALSIRKNIITATAKTFQPNLFIVDKEPLGLKKEVLPTLKWLRRCSSRTRTILGLRDIMDDADTVRADWEKKGVYDILDRLYDEIWVYGEKDFYDPVTEYGICDRVSQKIRYTGYIPRIVPGPESVKKVRRDHHLKEGEKLVVVTTGGGGDGFAIVDTYLTMLENHKFPVPIKSVIVTGPFMPKRQRREIYKRARALGIRNYPFYARMEELLGASDLVVSMGGYNTVCELLTLGIVPLIIPRETPRKEQLIRAKVMGERRLVDYIPWKDFSPERLLQKMGRMLENPEPYQDAISRFRLTGLETMRLRLEEFKRSAKP